MVKSADEHDAEVLLHRHLRQVERRSRRLFGLGATKAQILTVLRDIQLQRIERMTRSISQLGDEAAEATRSIAMLERVIKAATPKQKGKSSRGKRS